MSDPLSTALRDLADLDTDGLGARPLPVGEVRAGGDRRRRRRHAATSLAAAAAVAVVGIGATVVASPGPSEPSPAPGPAPTTPTEEPTQRPSPDAIDEPSPTTPAVELRIPADFPLNASYPTINEDTTPVKVSGQPGFGGLTLCGETILTASGAADVLGTKFVGAEDYRSRTLLLFETPAEALAVLQQAEQAVGACPTFDSSRFTPWQVPLGDRSFGFDQTYDDGPGGVTMALSSYIVVQVGRGVLIGTAYAEASGRSEEFNQGLADQAQGVVQAMGDLLP